MINHTHTSILCSNLSSFKYIFQCPENLNAYAKNIHNSMLSRACLLKSELYYKQTAATAAERNEFKTINIGEHVRALIRFVRARNFENYVRVRPEMSQVSQNRFNNA